MKFLKRVLVLLLTVGVAVGVIWKIREIRETRLRPDVHRDFGEAKEKPLGFAVMSDIHSDWNNFRKALEKEKNDVGFERDERFVIITGDLTTIGKKSELLEAKKILDENGLKYYVIPGNHDIWWGRKYKQDLWGEVFGKSFQSFKNDGYKFVLVNNGDGIGEFSNIKNKKEKIKNKDEELGQMDWIKKETEECLKVYCLVFMHIPLNHPNSLHVMGEENPIVASEAAQLIRLFVDNKVQEVFAGHLHFSSSYELDGLKTTIVGAVTADRNFQSPKFLEVVMENGNIEKRDVFLEE